jgi:uncharacterized cupredoxin-like copper-binding protein
MKTLPITTALAMSFAVPVFAAGTHAGGHAEQMAVGMPGNPGHVDRTIEVDLMELDDGSMVFDPGKLDIRKGETVRFVVTNKGELEHEFVLDTAEKNIEHKELMQEFPEMEHDDPNALRLMPGEAGEIVWTFSNDGDFEFACLIPGHYESGMFGPVAVN